MNSDRPNDRWGRGETGRVFLFQEVGNGLPGTAPMMLLHFTGLAVYEDFSPLVPRAMSS